MRTLDLRKLAHFVAVAEELSFTRAAARLQMSQQALSTSIRQFERELDVTLLDRSPHHVVVTEASSDPVASPKDSVLVGRRNYVSWPPHPCHVAKEDLS